MQVVDWAHRITLMAEIFLLVRLMPSIIQTATCFQTCKSAFRLLRFEGTDDPPGFFCLLPGSFVNSAPKAALCPRKYRAKHIVDPMYSKLLFGTFRSAVEAAYNLYGRPRDPLFLSTISVVSYISSTIGRAREPKYACQLSVVSYTRPI